MALAMAGSQSIMGRAAMVGKVESARNIGTPRKSVLGGPLMSAANSVRSMVPDFSSDVGRKKFGFSHEELNETGTYYEGQFKLHQRCGEGTIHDPDTGAKYVGQFQADQFHGEGDQVWHDGSTYKGQWVNGQKHGTGEYVNPEGLMYTGQWEQGLRHGSGAQTYMNGDRYEGHFYNGCCSGMGVYHFADGSRYEGVWGGGRYDGSGVFYGFDGSRERHWYTSGMLTKREVLTSSPVKARSKLDLIGGKVLYSQTRDEMQKPALLSKMRPSPHLIRRETAGTDLSAPPLRPRTVPVSARHPRQEDPLMDTQPLPSTAPARVQTSGLEG